MVDVGGFFAGDSVSFAVRGRSRSPFLGVGMLVWKSLRFLGLKDETTTSSDFRLTARSDRCPLTGELMADRAAAGVGGDGIFDRCLEAGGGDKIFSLRLGGTVRVGEPMRVEPARAGKTVPTGFAMGFVGEGVSGDLRRDGDAFGVNGLRSGRGDS